MNQRGVRTRTQLMDTAAALFAERGIDGVNLVELHEATGQRNKSAVQYHFGSRDGLVVAIIRRHQDRADQYRAQMLQSVDDDDLGGLVRVLVLPAAGNLESQQGRYYLRIVLHMAHRFGPADRVAKVGGLLGETLTRIGRHLDQLDPVVRNERLGSAFTFLIEAMASRAARLDRSDDDLLCGDVFVADLVAMIEALLTAPAPLMDTGPVTAGATDAA